MFSNIDSIEPQAADKISVEYQTDKGGTLEGREIEVSLVRKEVTRLSQDKNYFMDPDLEGARLCRPSSQDDILYRHWVATLKVPSLGINTSVDFYVNADQGDKINGASTLMFTWENPGRPAIESDKFKVIIFDPEVKTTSGEWKKATRFLVDIRSPDGDLPLNNKGELVGGYRKVYYKGRPAIEASFGYGYTDYVIDGNPNDYESSNATKAVIDLRGANAEIEEAVAEHSGDPTLVEDADILWAIQLWVSGEEVPGTGGQTIGDEKILELVQLWITGQPTSSSAAQSKPAQMEKSEGLTVRGIKLFPNPMEGTSMATFKAEGSGIAGIKVEIFNLAGVRVFEQEASSNTLEFNAMDNEGRPLANGVYLYVVTAKGFDGQTIRSGVRKLVILR